MSDTTLGASPKGDALDLILTVMNTIGSLWIFAMMVMIDTDAFSRTLFAHPFHGVIELVEMSIVGIVFMQLGDATRRKTGPPVATPKNMRNLGEMLLFLA